MIKIEKIEYDEEISVYDITVPETENFYANGILVHNCVEITLHADELHTFACVLSSMNLANYDKWKNTDAVYVATIFLDCVNQELIEMGKNISGLENTVRSAEKSRALGLGVLGYHSYLQSKMIPFDSLEAFKINEEIFKHIHDETERASRWMAKVLGEPEWCKGTGLRNTHRTAVAPTMTNAIISGGHSQGIEPIYSNVYKQRMAGGTVFRISPMLLKIMKERGVYSQALVDKIGNEYGGSVQSDDIDFLTPHEKNVFKTFHEINQYAIIDQANDRQKYICQSQSLNLAIKAKDTEEYVADLTQYAMAQPNIFGLYYQRGEPTSKSSSGKSFMDNKNINENLTKNNLADVDEPVDCPSCEA